MSFRRKIALVLLLALGALISLTMWGYFHACRWATAVGHSTERAYASPQSFGASASPEGDFVVTVEGPKGLRKALVRYLERELPRVASGASRVIVVDDTASFVPRESAPSESNMLYVHVEASLIWTPLYAKFTDTALVKFSNGYVPGWPNLAEEVIEITGGEVRVKGNYSGSGTGLGLIGRPYADTFRAELLGDFIKKAITDAYTEIRNQAAKQVTQ